MFWPFYLYSDFVTYTIIQHCFTFQQIDYNNRPHLMRKCTNFRKNCIFGPKIMKSVICGEQKWMCKKEAGNCVDAPQSPPTQLVSLNLQNFALLQRTVGSLTNRASVSKRPLNAVEKFFRKKKRRLTFQVVGKPAKPIQSRNSSSLFLGQKSDT